ncbi:MAG: anti-anti-sigma factor [Proteobacteria bacterium]|nr:anti-anti-sigma factor [Pseudomonadota bacterium]MBU0968530.1 anti-anti-sigma factor [Pseudomonadota bacterium]
MQPFSFFSLGTMLLVSIQEDIGDAEVSRMFDSLSRQVSEKKFLGVIVDLHNLEVVDSYMAGYLQDMAATLRLLHAHMVVVGLSVPVVMTLTDFGIRLSDLEFALDVEKAVSKLEEKMQIGGN